MVDKPRIGVLFLFLFISISFFIQHFARSLDVDPPTNELVQKVKELYHKRVSDVRFLIPVLNGLHKHEIVDVLPKLITQSPNVVKEVFNRLLGSSSQGK